jgi:cation:H+ antiporter
VSTPLALVAFFGGALVSLSTSWVVVSRIERVGARMGATEALLGVVAALAGDAPEITSAVSALIDHQGAVAAGVAIGSNVFNLAALLGLGAVVAGGISLHRRAVALQGAIAIWIALACVLTVTGVIDPPEGLAVVGVVLVPYVVLAATSGSRRWQRPDCSRWERWIAAAIAEEEIELSATVHPRRGRSVDVLTATGALVIVVVASVVMEHAAARLGTRFSVSAIVVGGVGLAAVTSLPNAVAAMYWARRDRGVAMLSTGLNSNAFNVAAGWLIPAVVLGLGRRSGPETLTAGWYLGLTAVAVAVAYGRRALSRRVGWAIIVLYVAFVAVLALGV